MIRCQTLFGFLGQARGESAQCTVHSAQYTVHSTQVDVFSFFIRQEKKVSSEQFRFALRTVSYKNHRR